MRPYARLHGPPPPSPRAEYFISALWRPVEFLDLRIFAERVDSADNPSDAPSRDGGFNLPPFLETGPFARGASLYSLVSAFRKQNMDDVCRYPHFE